MRLRGHPFAVAALVAVAYSITARLSLALVVEPAGVAALWPPSGVLFAALCLLERRTWLPTLAFFLIGNVLANTLAGRSLGLSVGFSIANGFDAVLGAWLFLRFSGSRDRDLASLRQALAFLVLPVLAVSTVSGLLVGTFLAMTSPALPLLEVWMVWSPSNALGILVVAPAIMAVVRGNWTWQRLRSHAFELLALLASLLLFSTVFFQRLDAPSPIVSILPYLAFPLLMWAALRFGPAGAAASSFLLSTVAVWTTAHGRGPLALLPGTPAEQLLPLQIYLAATVASGLLLAALMAERERAEDALHHSQAQLLQAQKMEAVGQLAGGVAHDFNNLLTAIRGHAELALSRVEDTDAKNDLEQIIAAGDRAAGLTRRLLAFSRRQLIAPVPTGLSTVIERAETLLRRLIGENIELVTEVAPALWPVLADPSQLEQVIMNLAINARDAMPNGGTLTLIAENVTIAPSDPNPDLPRGELVQLIVRDTGHGISEQVRAHLFEPFHTTKSTGTGLGLAITREIIAQCGGHILVESAPGAGASFSLYLPRAPGVAEAPLPPSPASPNRRGHEIILLVEDEPSVRDSTARTLTSLGYQVLTASNGVEGLELARRCRDEIRLVLTDVIMPQMGGRELAKRLRSEGAAAPILFMSGYDDGAGAAAEGEPLPIALPKPFSASDLAERVREALDRR